MEAENETKLMVKPIETLTLAPYKKLPVAYNFTSATYPNTYATLPHTKIVLNDKQVKIYT